jgi:copper chaperone NosL
MITAASRRPLLALAALLLAACSQSTAPVAAVEPNADTACALDGMTLRDYPGPKAQIVYEDGKRDFFCDTTEMFSMLLKPETRRRVKAAYTQDMAQAEWRHPQGAWIDARGAVYVAGSKLMGSMGPTFAAFAARPAAEAFVKEHGGKIYAFAEVTPEMADLRGGAGADEHM